MAYQISVRYRPNCKVQSTYSKRILYFCKSNIQVTPRKHGTVRKTDIIAGQPVIEEKENIKKNDKNYQIYVGNII